MRQWATRFLMAFSMAAALGLPAGHAWALNWRIAPDQSQITFDYTEDGAPAQGRFERFEGLGEFDRARPQRARLDLTIEIDSIQLSSGFRSSFVKTETWFDAENFPEARFKLEEIALADPAKPAPAEGETARYRVAGVLEIKGAEQEVDTVIDLTLEARRARAVGSLAFKRSDFNIGDRIGGLFVELGDEIIVNFDIIANRL